MRRVLGAADLNAAWQRADRALVAALRCAATAIKREARGRTCGECRHFAGAFCSAQESADGWPLKIYGPAATACSKYEAD